MAISDKLAYLAETKEQLKTALNNKGVTVADTATFRSYVSRLSSLPFKFSTTAALEEATTQVEGDTALVHRNNPTTLTSTLETATLEFPETKSISLAPTTAVTGTLVAVDGSSLPLVNISATTTSLTVNITTKTGETHTIEYTGVTSGSFIRTTKYTRVTAIEKVELGAPVKFSGTWDVRYATLQGVDFFYGGAYEYKDAAWSRLDEGTVLEVTPKTTSQSFSNYYNTVNVAAVDSTIDSDIIANNIRKNINILGVVGTLEDGAKVFNSVEDMNNSTGNKTDEYCIINEKVVQDIVARAYYEDLYLPPTITFNEAITEDTTIYLDTSDRAFLVISATGIQFKLSMSGMTVTNSNISYTSADGITYTKTSSVPDYTTVEELYTINGITVVSRFYVDETDIDLVSQIIKTIGYRYAGTYQYSGATWTQL